MATTTVDALTKQLEQLKLQYSQLLTSFNGWVVEVQKYRTLAEQCSAARASVSVNKDKQCKLTDLNYYNQQWDANAKQRDAIATLMDGVNKQIKDLEQKIAAQQQIDLANYNSSPQGQQQAAANQLAAQKNELDAKNQRTMIIAGAVVILIAATVFVYIRFFRK